MNRRLLPLLILLLAAPAQGAEGQVVLETLTALPEPVSNNATVLLAGEQGATLYSFQGLAEGRTWADVHQRAWKLAPGASKWQQFDSAPIKNGRLAGVAAAVNGTAWLFGGYTVAEDGSEVSTPEVFRIDQERDALVHVSDMPVPVDDMTAFVYRDRYIYLVSGWHDLGNVNLVQVLDTQTLSWAQATPYPGAAVFGHAGGMSGNRMMVCGGVRIEYPEDGSARNFLPSEQCWFGIVDESDHRRIRWQPAGDFPGAARYRMAAAADDRGRVVFIGGSSNPYNYDGIGYNKLSSEPEPGVFRFDLEKMEWESGWSVIPASMDHRGLQYHEGWFYLVGGMLAGQQVTGRAIRFRVAEPAAQ